MPRGASVQAARFSTSLIMAFRSCLDGVTTVRFRLAALLPLRRFSRGCRRPIHPLKAPRLTTLVGLLCAKV
jgi:hypothetical protein